MMFRQRVTEKIRQMEISAGLAISALIVFVLSLFLIMLPVSSLLQIAEKISPLHSIQPKTDALIRWIKYSYPLIGVTVILAIFFSKRLFLRDRIDNLLENEKLIYGVILLSVVITAAWIIFFPTHPYADSDWYFEKGGFIASGYGYVTDLVSRNPTAAWPVGYPAFLGVLFFILGTHLIVAKLANLLLIVLMVHLLYKVNLRLFNHQVAAISSIILATLPGIFMYSSLVNSDLLFMFLNLWLFSRIIQPDDRKAGSKWNSVVGTCLNGMIYGISILTRSTGLFFLPVWICIRFWTTSGKSRKNLLTWSLLFTVSSGLTVLPWAVRNAIHFREFIPVSTNGGVVFWVGNNPNAYGGYMFPRDESNPLFTLIGDELAVNRTGLKLGMQFIRENPLRAIQLLPAKAFYLLNSNDAGVEWNLRSAQTPNQVGSGLLTHVIVNLTYLVMVSFSFLGLLVLILAEKSKHKQSWTGLCFVIGLMLVHLPFFGNDRFLLPALPFLIMYASYGISRILGLGNNNRPAHVFGEPP